MVDLCDASEVVNFLAQLKLLGSALMGGRDWTAELCEQGSSLPGRDLTEADIASWRVLHDGKREPVPLTWAIPGIMELRTRGA
jgi:hypothetical protein